jgi:pimeloyl-ACP methyl ester carboxylesterase
MRSSHRRIGVATFAVTALTVPVGVASAAPPPEAPPAPTLAWTDCEDGFECATLTVPRSYADPGGDVIELSVIRKVATDPAQRIGSLLTNPGGPGGSGVDYVRAVATEDGSLATLNQRFDIVSWDPRGTKGSEPVNCFNDAESDEYNETAKAFPTGFDRDAILQTSRDFIDACLANSTPEQLASISTENTARDMDMLRAALGEAQISYLGYSYGTYLGATYSALYPDNIRAFVLDGAVDPRQYANNPIGANIDQARGFETAIDRYFNDFCGDACQFQGGKAAWRTLVEQLEATPSFAGLDPTRPVNGTSVINATLISMYVRPIWPVLDRALAEAAAGDTRRIQLLADIAVGRNDDGTYDAGGGAFPAITAIDASYPTEIVIQDLLGLIYPTVSPSFGPSTFWASLAGGYSAFEWPVEADTRYTGPFRYPSGRTNARLLTMNGDGHTAYGDNSTCIDDAVEAFFFDSVVPARGTTCEVDPEAAPPPIAPAAEAAAAELGAASVESSDAMASLTKFAGAMAFR